jgi:NADH-quinone oxidoreductase subunit M
VVEKETLKSMLDLSRREIAILVPLAILTVLFGVYPDPIMKVTAASVDQLVGNYNAALAAAGKIASLAP